MPISRSNTITKNRVCWVNGNRSWIIMLACNQGIFVLLSDAEHTTSNTLDEVRGHITHITEQNRIGCSVNSFRSHEKLS